MINNTLKQIEEEFDKKFCNEKHYDSSSVLHSNYQNGGIGRMLVDQKSFLKSSIIKVLEQLVEKIPNLEPTWMERTDGRDDSYDDAFEDGGEVAGKKIREYLQSEIANLSTNIDKE